MKIDGFIVKKPFDLVLDLETKFQEWRLPGMDFFLYIYVEFPCSLSHSAAFSLFGTRRACSF